MNTLFIRRIFEIIYSLFRTFIEKEDNYVAVGFTNLDKDPSTVHIIPRDSPLFLNILKKSSARDQIAKNWFKLTDDEIEDMLQNNLIQKFVLMDEKSPEIILD